jgi:DNA polymerase-3 subunit alpha
VMAGWKSGDAVKVVERIERTKEMTFVSLHHHTTFSFLDGYGTPESHVRRSAELGMTRQAVTEHGNVSSHVRHEQACNDQGVTPIFGCELYCGDVAEETRSRRKNHLTVLAQNDEGYRNLLRLVSRGFAEGFYFEPTVSGAMLSEHREGLVVLSGCSGSLLATSLIGGKNIEKADASYERAKKQALKFKRALGDSFFLEVQAFPELEATRAINSAYARLSKEIGVPLVATLDAHYTRPDESEMQQILHNVRPGKKQTMEDRARSWGYHVPLSPLSDNEIYRRLIGTGLSKAEAEGAIRMARTIGDSCNVKLPKVQNLEYPLPEGIEDKRVLFRKIINDGWHYRGYAPPKKECEHSVGPCGHNHSRALSTSEHERYVERVKYEMRLIEEKGFIDYFLMVSDIVVFCKDVDSRPEHFKKYPVVPVGPARGSAAASLVCYLMRITEIDPMLFPTLLFERFIDLNRFDLPDIDLDFDDEYRWLVKAYAEWKYGAEKVGNIGTFTKYKGKNSLQDVATAYNIPKFVVDEVKGMLIERSSGDLRAGNTVEDSIEMFPKVKEIFDANPNLYKAMRLEGNVRGMSIHAAGLVIANGPLTDVCAVYTKADAKTGETIQVVSLDKHDAEYLNVLKLDALGLNTMALIRIALDMIGMTLEELYAQPLDHEDVIQGFKENDVVGVFQFDGRAMRSVNQGVSPDNFMEIADVNALARPGPLHSGATAEYIDVKHGRAEAVHYHPIIDEITRHTNFQIVYQEQILQVVRELGMFSWEEAARIRKIISKKRGEQEFNQQRDKFIDGAATHGMSGDDANKVFSMLATAGAYAFNAAHCVSYGMLAYWTMFLKRRYPREFYVGALQKYDKEKMGTLLADLAKFGRDIQVAPFNPNIAQERWSLHNGSIYPGFTQVRGIGPKLAPIFLAARADEPGGKFKDWQSMLKIKGVGQAKIDAMKNMHDDPDPFKIFRLGQRLDAMREHLATGVPEVPGSPFMLPSPTHTATGIPYERTPSNVSVVWLGVVRNRNLKDLFESHHSKTGQHLDPDNVKDPHLKEWVVMYCEDDTDVVTVTIDRWKYNRFKDRIWDIEEDETLVLFRGYKMGIQSRRAIYVNDMWLLDELDKEEEE